MMQNPQYSRKWYQLKIHVSPLSSQKAHIFGKLREIRQPFSDLDHGKWNSQNLHQNAQNLPNLPTLTMNQAKFAQSVPISRGSLYPWAKLPKLAAICTFWHITQNSPTIFRFELQEIKAPNFTANCTKSTQFTNPYSESCEISLIHTNF